MLKYKYVVLDTCLVFYITIRTLFKERSRKYRFVYKYRDSVYKVVRKTQNFIKFSPKEQSIS